MDEAPVCLKKSPLLQAIQRVAGHPDAGNSFSWRSPAGVPPLPKRRIGLRVPRTISTGAVRFSLATCAGVIVISATVEFLAKNAVLSKFFTNRCLRVEATLGNHRDVNGEGHDSTQPAQPRSPPRFSRFRSIIRRSGKLAAVAFLYIIAASLRDANAQNTNLSQLADAPRRARNPGAGPQWHRRRATSFLLRPAKWRAQPAPPAPAPPVDAETPRGQSGDSLPTLQMVAAAGSCAAAAYAMTPHTSLGVDDQARRVRRSVQHSCSRVCSMLGSANLAAAVDLWKPIVVAALFAAVATSPPAPGQKRVMLLPTCVTALYMHWLATTPAMPRQQPPEAPSSSGQASRPLESTCAAISSAKAAVCHSSARCMDAACVGVAGFTKGLQGQLVLLSTSQTPGARCVRATFTLLVVAGAAVLDARHRRAHGASAKAGSKVVKGLGSTRGVALGVGSGPAKCVHALLRPLCLPESLAVGVLLCDSAMREDYRLLEGAAAVLGRSVTAARSTCGAVPGCVRQCKRTAHQLGSQLVQLPGQLRDKFRFPDENSPGSEHVTPVLASASIPGAPAMLSTQAADDMLQQIDRLVAEAAAAAPHILSAQDRLSSPAPPTLGAADDRVMKVQVPDLPPATMSETGSQENGYKEPQSAAWNPAVAPGPHSCELLQADTGDRASLWSKDMGEPCLSTREFDVPEVDMAPAGAVATAHDSTDLEQDAATAGHVETPVPSAQQTRSESPSTLGSDHVALVVNSSASGKTSTGAAAEVSMKDACTAVDVDLLAPSQPGSSTASNLASTSDAATQTSSEDFDNGAWPTTRPSLSAHRLVLPESPIESSPGQSVADVSSLTVSPEHRTTSPGLLSSAGAREVGVGTEGEERGQVLPCWVSDAREELASQAAIVAPSPEERYEGKIPHWVLHVFSDKIPDELDISYSFMDSMEAAESVRAQPWVKQIYEELDSLSAQLPTDIGDDVPQLFTLREDLHHLDHAGFGLSLIAARLAADCWRDACETEPARFMEEAALPCLLHAVSCAARFIGADDSDCVPVLDTNTAVTTLLSSIPLRSGDAVLVLSSAMPTVKTAIGRQAMAASAYVVEVSADRSVIRNPQLLVSRLHAALRAARGAVKVAVLEHVLGFPPLVLPLVELAAVCREHNVITIVDGTYVMGNMLLSVPSLQVDAYITACDKWLYAPKGTALMWVAPGLQPSIKGLVPSSSSGLGFLGDQMWMTAADMAPWLSVPMALELFNTLGFEQIRRHRMKLLAEGIDVLVNAFGHAKTSVDDLPVVIGGSMLSSQRSSDLPLDLQHLNFDPSASMAAVRLPQVPNYAPTTSGAQLLHNHLRHRCNVEVPIVAWECGLWARVSVALYNTYGDFFHLAHAVRVLSKVPEHSEWQKPTLMAIAEEDGVGDVEGGDGDAACKGGERSSSQPMQDDAALLVWKPAEADAVPALAKPQ